MVKKEEEKKEEAPTVGGYSIHPLCAKFPWIEEPTYSALKEDIRKYGQRDTIKLFKGMVLDGKNRLRICTELKIEPKIEKLPDDTNVVAYVRSVGLHRRDLTPPQRISIALELEEWEKIQSGTKEKIEKIKLDQNQKDLLEVAENKRIAKDANSDAETVRKFRVVKEISATREMDDPTIFRKVMESRITIERAHAKLTQEPLPPKRRIAQIDTPDEVALKVMSKERSQYRSEAAFWQKKCEELIAFLKKKGLWDEVKGTIFPIAEIDTVEYPSVKQMREAELL